MHAVLHRGCLQVIALAACTLAAATSATGEPRCRRAKHVLYATFERPHLYQYVTAFYTARSLAPSTTIHVLNLVNTNTSLATARHAGPSRSGHAAFLARSGVQWHDVDLKAVVGYSDLRRHYIHSSTNGVDYEMLCLARFLAMADFCRTLGIDTFTHLDGDVAVFDAAFLDHVCIPDGYASWYLSGASSFLHTISCHEVGAFADYILRFYVRSSRTDVVRDIVAHGGPNANIDRASVEAAAPEFRELGMKPPQFSDMYVLDAFMRAPTSSGGNPHRRFTRYIQSTQQGGITPYLRPFGRLLDLFPGHDNDLCQANHRIMAGKLRLNETHQQAHVNGTWHVLPGAHFQGAECKGLLEGELALPLLKLFA